MKHNRITHLMSSGVVASAVASVVAPASASFVGLDVQVNFVDGYHVANLYAVFDSPNDVVLNVVSLQPIIMFFHHDDFIGDSWAPQFTPPPGDTDTFITIGGGPGFQNTTIATDFGGGSGVGFYIDAGTQWFNSNPPNQQGKVDPTTLSTLLGQFAFEGDIDPFIAALMIGYNQGAGTAAQFGTGSLLVPAPACTALFAVALLRQSRRRSY